MKSYFYTLLFTLLLFTSTAHSQQHTFIEGFDSSLISLDISGCTSYINCKLPDNFSIACTPDGRLWGTGADSIGPCLYKIDTLTGLCTLTGHFEKGGNSLVALNDSTLLTENSDSLYAISITNMHSHLVGYIGYTAYGDLTWYGSDLYMMAIDNNSSSLLIKITFDSNYSTITNAAPVSDIPSLPNCAALATVFLPNAGGYSIVGFDGTDAYAISLLDGSYTLLCSSIISSSAYLAEDAASKSYPMSTAIGVPIDNDIMPKIYPNPTSSILYIENYENTNTILTLTDMAGRIVLHQGLIKGTNQVPMDGLSAGMYMATIQTAGNKTITMKKIVKQ